MINHLKNIFTRFSLGYPKLTITFTLLLTMLIVNGFKYVVQDDDMVKLLPDDMQSIITFGEINEEFGNYEFMYVAMGVEGEDALNKEFLNIAWDISKEFEELDECEEVISISTMSKMFFDPLDSSIVVDDLMPNRINSNDDIN